MHISILGSAAGGGFPQWNCNHPVSRQARAGVVEARPRTQSSIAISTDRQHWFLCNASPDLRQQINQTPSLQPPAHGPLRASPIAGVVLSNADVDHIAGLLSLRERQPLCLYATARVHDVLDANPVFRVLDPSVVSRERLTLESDHILSHADGTLSGLVVRPFAVPGKVALWLEGPDKPVGDALTEDTIALEIRDVASTSRVLYVPGCAALPAWLCQRMRDADLVLFDGTLWDDSEMIDTGVGVKSGRRMGHIPISGPEGSLALLAPMTWSRKIYIHLNTTNPVLLDHSLQRAEVEAAGWEVAFDGMEICL